MLESFHFLRSELLNSAIPPGSGTFCAIPFMQFHHLNQLRLTNVFTIEVKPKEERKENNYPAHSREHKAFAANIVMCEP